MIFFKKSKNQTEQVDSVELLVKDIHNEFNTEVEKLLADAKTFRSLETNKQSLIDKSARLKRLGFNNKEVEEADLEIKRLRELEKENTNKREIIDAIDYFSYKYPLYKFITDDSVKKICEKYGLVYGDVKFYKGTVPDKNLKQIEEFKISDDDKCCLQKTRYSYRRDDDIKFICYRDYKALEKSYWENWKKDQLSSSTRYESYDTCPLEIAAPAADFDLELMEIKDFKITKIKVPDPIVLQPVFFRTSKYYLIITAWGPEASDQSAVNEKMN